MTPYANASSSELKEEMLRLMSRAETLVAERNLAIATLMKLSSEIKTLETPHLRGRELLGVQVACQCIREKITDSLKQIEDSGRPINHNHALVKADPGFQQLFAKYKKSEQA